MSAYTAFPIMTFKTGLNTYLQPWVRPEDAFEPLTNAYVYRGVVTKRNGYTQYGNTLDDDNPVMGIMQYQNEDSGAISLVVASTENLYLYDAGANTFNNLAISPTFTGTIVNFFNYCNWQPVAGATTLMYMANGVDPITTFDGTATVNQPTITINGAGQTITSTLDVKVYKNRLLAIRPTLSTQGVQGQAIYWSAINNPTGWRTDIAGQGGFLVAPTGDLIQSAEFIRDILVVFFTNSTYIFRYTGNDTDPFRWDKVNNSKSTNAPYASLQYDERVTSVGNTGLIACDGVNVQRYDIPVVDYYETNFSELYYGQAFSQRYDNLNQAWTLYVSTQNTFPLVGSLAPGSDQALIYNFVEQSWATYVFPIPMTCMGLFYSQSGTTWAQLSEEPTNWWTNTPDPWNSYFNQSRAPILLMGDTTGHVWLMDDSESVFDYIVVEGDNVPTPIVPDIVSTKWNPVIQSGEKLQFGYIDIYYYIASTNPAAPIQVTLNFYVDNSETKAVSKTLTLDGPVNSEYTFKRIYPNLIGQFIKMEIDPDVDAKMQFLGFILWVRPAGRLTGP